MQTRLTHCMTLLRQLTDNLLHRFVSTSLKKRWGRVGKKAGLQVLPTLKTQGLDFPEGPVVKYPPADAEDTGSIPGAGRSHTSQGNEACRQLLSLRTQEPACHNWREAQVLQQRSRVLQRRPNTAK